MNHEQRERLAFQQRVIDKEIRYLDCSKFGTRHDSTTVFCQYSDQRPGA